MAPSHVQNPIVYSDKTSNALDSHSQEDKRNLSGSTRVGDTIIKIPEQILKQPDPALPPGVDAGIDISQPPTTAELLHIYRTALGIPNLDTFTRSPSDHSFCWVRSSPKPKGLYKALLDAERHSRRSYKYYRFTLAFCLLFQVLIGAVLTALGASNASHITITVVSALSTIVAGNVTLIKGQGLPGRVRSDWLGWKGVRDFLREREGEIAAGMYTLKSNSSSSSIADGFGGGWEAVFKEVRTVQTMYKAVQQTVANNRPDSYQVVDGAAVPSNGGTTNTRNKNGEVASGGDSNKNI